MSANVASANIFMRLHEHALVYAPACASPYLYTYIRLYARKYTRTHTAPRTYAYKLTNKHITHAHATAPINARPTLIIHHFR